jgi:hypothetical protein
LFNISAPEEANLEDCFATVELSGLAIGESHPKLLEPLEILNCKERKESRVKRKKVFGRHR